MSITLWKREWGYVLRKGHRRQQISLLLAETAPVQKHNDTSREEKMNDQGAYKGSYLAKDSRKCMDDLDYGPNAAN